MLECWLKEPPLGEWDNSALSACAGWLSAVSMAKGKQMKRSMLGIAGLVSGAVVFGSNLAYIDRALATEGELTAAPEMLRPRLVGPHQWSVLVPIVEGERKEDALEAAIRIVKRRAADRAPELVTATRTLAGEHYEERIRSLSAVFVSATIVTEKERVISGKSYLEIVVRAAIEEIPTQRIAEALAADRIRATRLRELELEVSRLEAVLMGIPLGQAMQEHDRARRRAALDALLASETEIKQTFGADGLMGLRQQAEDILGAAVDVFERDIVSSVRATEADARIERVTRALDGETSEFRRRNPSVHGEPFVALTKVYWSLPRGIDEYASILGRWFRVSGAMVSSDYGVNAGGLISGAQGICVGPNDGRSEFPEASRLFDYLRTRAVEIKIEVATAAPKKSMGFEVQIAGPFNGGALWCLFDTSRDNGALPFRSPPGIYAFSRGAALSSLNPYRLVISEEDGASVSHLSVNVLDQRL